MPYIIIQYKQLVILFSLLMKEPGVAEWSLLLTSDHKHENTDVGSSSSIHLKCFSFQTPTDARGILRSVLFMSPHCPLLFSHDVAEQLTKVTINTNNISLVID